MDLTKTLTQLERSDWGEATYPSYLVTRCHYLRTIPLKDFEAGDFRIMIGQQISLPILVPLALKMLQQNPFIKGTHYKGDLLGVVMNLPSTFWATLQWAKRDLDDIVLKAKEQVDTASDEERDDYERVEADIERFQKQV